MADLSQTVANVSAYSNVTTALYQAGEAINPGDVVYKKTSDNKYYKALNTGSEEAAAVGIALSYAPAADDYFIAATGGDIDPGAAGTVGETYFVSNTAGKLAPSADIGAGEYVTRLGSCKLANKIAISIAALGVAHA